MDLANYEFPKSDLMVNTTPELVKEAESRKLNKGKEKFNELFFRGGKIELQDDVKGTWKEGTYLYARSLMGSFAPKHEKKEIVCAMIFEETLKL